MVFEHFWNLFDFEDVTIYFTQLFPCCVGHIPRSIAHAFSVTRLFALAKPSKSIWLIVVREVLYWLVNKTLYLQFHDFFERPYLFCSFPSFSTNSPPSIQPSSKFLETPRPKLFGLFTCPLVIVDPTWAYFVSCAIKHFTSWPWWWRLSKRRTLPWFTPNICVFPPCDIGFWLLTPTNGQFFSLMC